MRKSALRLAALLAAALTLTGCSLPWGGGAPVAVVDGQAVTRGDLQRRLATLAFLNGLHATGPAARRQVLAQLVDETLLVREARRRGLGGGPEAVAGELARLTQGRALPARGAASLRQGLQSYAADLVGLHALWESLDEGSEPSPDQVRAYFDAHGDAFLIPERVHLWRLDLASATAAASALQELRAGTDPRSVAGQFAPGRAEVGYVTRDVPLDAAIAAAAFSLRPGQISDVLQSSSGWTVVRVLDVYPESPLPYNTVAGVAGTLLAGERQRQALSHLLAGLHQRAHIEVFAGRAA